MDTTAAQWPPQEIVVKAMEEKVERKIRPQREKVLNCPRCNSTNTKFCYYNNYSLSQPRYFCKSCRRYWTEGGSLRNIPVGGGSRKNKRPPSSSTSSLSLSSSSNKLPDLVPPPPPQNPSKIPDAQDLDLGFALHHHHHHRIADMIHLPPFDSGAAATTGGLSLGSFMPPLPPEFKPSSLSFSLDGLGSGYGSFQGVGESINGKLLFPFEDLKVSNTNNNNNARDQNGDHNANGYWNGVIGGGGSW